MREIVQWGSRSLCCFSVNIIRCIFTMSLPIRYSRASIRYVGPKYFPSTFHRPENLIKETPFRLMGDYLQKKKNVMYAISLYNPEGLPLTPLRNLHGWAEWADAMSIRISSTPPHSTPLPSILDTRPLRYAVNDQVSNVRCIWGAGVCSDWHDSLD